MRRLPAVLATVALVVLAGCAGGLPAPTTTPGTSTPTTSTPGATTTTTVQTTQVTVTDVADGDTIDVRYGNGSTDTVRLLGVDTPEVYVDNTPGEFEGVPNTDAGATCLRSAGHDASAFTNRTLLHEQVGIAVDTLSDRRGSYGRLLAYVYVDGENVNYRLVDDGYARVYDSQFTESERFYAAEADAQAAHEGLWHCAADVTTTRAGDGTLVVATVHADASGPDGENLNDEYVVLENTGSDALDLGGWTVSDDGGHTYTVPDGVTLAADATVTLHTGSGTDTASDRYWGAGSPVWNNGGDTVVVTDASGTVQARRAY